MLQAAKEFRVGRPQIFAGLMLLAFVAQCLWAAADRKISELEYVYIAAGLGAGQLEPGTISPMTSWSAAVPVHVIRGLKRVAPARLNAALSIPRAWIIRLPFVAFGVWLGGALWWVARRLYGDSGGYVAVGLYCSSPSMVMISSNVGPEVILAWSIFGLIYTAIGVAHTLYAPARKWLPRIAILGLAIGFAISTVLWSFTIVLLAFAFMIYLAPGRRREVVIVVSCASVIALAVLRCFSWASGTSLWAGWLGARPSIELATSLKFVFVDDYALVALFLICLTAYGSWARARYFGNTVPLLASFTVVLLFSLLPRLHIWKPVLGVPFAFVFIGGVMADLLETAARRAWTLVLGAGFLVRIVLGVYTLATVWIGNGSVR